MQPPPLTTHTHTMSLQAILYALRPGHEQTRGLDVGRRLQNAIVTLLSTVSFLQFLFFVSSLQFPFIGTSTGHFSFCVSPSSFLFFFPSQLPSSSYYIHISSDVSLYLSLFFPLCLYFILLLYYPWLSITFISLLHAFPSRLFLFSILQLLFLLLHIYTIHFSLFSCHCFLLILLSYSSFS